MLARKKWKIQFAAAFGHPNQASANMRHASIASFIIKSLWWPLPSSSESHSRGVTKMGDKADDQDKQVGEIYNLAFCCSSSLFKRSCSSNSLLISFLYLHTPNHYHTICTCTSIYLILNSTNPHSCLRFGHDYRWSYGRSRS